MVDDNFAGDPTRLSQSSHTMLAAKLVGSEKDKVALAVQARRAEEGPHRF